jgi:hypothetical protein
MPYEARPTPIVFMEIKFTTKYNLHLYYMLIMMSIFVPFRNEVVQVDFGGFGKGYALERIRKLLLSHGILNAFISFGESSVLALGNHPHGTGWKAGVNHQMITGNSLFSFDLQNESLSTSGMGQILYPFRGITVDILPSLKERDSSGFYEAWDSTPSRFLVGFC